MKQILKTIIGYLIQFTEYLMFRNAVIMDNKFVYHESLEDVEVLSRDGYHKATDLYITKPYQVYEVKFSDGTSIECADNHLFFDINLRTVYAKDLVYGQVLYGKDKPKVVLEVVRHPYKFYMYDISVDSGEHSYYTGDVLSHNTTTSAIFILWFVLFHKEKNVLMLGDILDTTKEIIDKVKQIMNNLPFFMKPGILINNVQSMKLDNGCRIIGRSTTKKSAIGLSIDLLYMDEFAHISANFIDDFWRSTYPTISGTPGSRIIITSTPNGMNKFNTLWNSAIDAVEREGDSNFYPLRVDWWQVKGRDEEWKQKTIADLGSVEDFNQEYGLQFFKGDNLLLNSSDIKKLYNIKTKFVSRAIPCMNIDKTYFKKGEIHKVKTDFSQFLTWHPIFLKHNFTSDIDDLKKDDNYYVFGIDTSKGVGKDYHVCNIFKVAPMPLNRVLMNKNNIEEEIDVFSLIQIGMFRCNSINIETFSDVVNTIVFDLFNYENVRIGIELNNQGIVVRDKLLRNANYWTGMIIFNKEKEDDLYYEPGTNLSSNKMKVKYCESFQQNVSIDKVITTSEITFAELSNFGSNEGRTIYRCQTGHDDIALSCIHANVFIGSPQYKEIGWDYWDKLERDSAFTEYRRIVQHDVIEANQERNGTGAKFDLNEVMDMQ